MNAASAPIAPPARLRRSPDHKVIAGVCAGLGEFVGVDPVVFRIAAVLLGLAGGAGFILYAMLWAVVPLRAAGEPAPTDAPAPGRPRQIAGVAFLLASSLLVLHALGLGFIDQVVWPAALVSVGLVVLWRQTDPSMPSVPASAPADRRRTFIARGLRVLIGAALIAGGAAWVLISGDGLASVGQGVLAVVIVLGGLGLVFGPWIYRLVRALTEERSQRIRSDERAQVATHLHDSVLQTLALIQRRSDDKAAVATLARRQERELRAWLYGEEDTAGDARFAPAVRRAMADVEDHWSVPVDVVTVGDAELDDSLRAMVLAAREAATNAAKFSGAEKVSVYAEVSTGDVEVFVHDRGRGFDPAAVGDDRRGIAHSIIGRMDRHGGQATVTSAPGDGAEVELRLPLPAPPS